MDKWLETRQFPTSLISASGFVFKEDKVLMIKHKKRGWSFPGGVSDEGEPVLDCLKREIYEESGINVEPKELIGVYQRLKPMPGYGPLQGSEVPPVIVLAFKCDYLEGKETVSEENDDAAWFTLQEAKQLISDPYTMLTFNDLLEYDGNVSFRYFETTQDIRKGK